jgi:molybdate transport system substrate-binding protein
MSHARKPRCALLQSGLVALAAFLLGCLGPRPAHADEVHVAVSANFASTLEKLAARFAQKTGHKLVLSAGATGALYAQIKAGAPFEVFLSADAERPRQLEQERLAVSGTRFVYAQGKLVLWSPKAGVVDAQGRVLTRKDLPKVALADPALAPYGAVAQAVLSKLGLWQSFNERAALVLGASVTQAYQFVASGNALCGFVAYAQVLEGKKPGSVWHVPQSMYAPLLQEAVLLKQGEAKRAARDLLAWLKDDEAVSSLLRAAGYARSRP